MVMFPLSVDGEAPRSLPPHPLKDTSRLHEQRMELDLNPGTQTPESQSSLLALLSPGLTLSLKAGIYSSLAKRTSSSKIQIIFLILQVHEETLLLISLPAP